MVHFAEIQPYLSYEIAHQGEELYNREEVGILTFTRYPTWKPGQIQEISNVDKVRGNIAVQTIEALTSHGYSVFVDSSTESSGDFLYHQRELGATVIDRTTNDRSESIFSAVSSILERKDIKAVVMMEPEKASLASYIPGFVLPILEDRADVMILNRNPILYRQTWPTYMYESEMAANIYLNRLYKTKKYLDFFSGPFAWKNSPDIYAKIWKKFTRKMPNVGIGKSMNQMVTYMPTAYALTSGLRVEPFEAPITYPISQRLSEDSPSAYKKEFSEKRRNQRIGLITQRLIQVIDEIQNCIVQ